MGFRTFDDVLESLRVAKVHDYGYVQPDDPSMDDDEDEDDQSWKQESARDNKKVLGVKNVDFLVPENVTQHHTDEFDITELSKPKLVVRRGQPFNIRITFNREYDPQKDDLRLVFEIGQNPLSGKGTHVEFALSDKDVRGEWGAWITDPSSNKTSINIAVLTPPTCIVGVWKFKVAVVKKKKKKTSVFRYMHRDPIYILFNPWCRDDAVFLDRDAERDAYVIEDKGKIYIGNQRQLSARPWVFGQFSGNVLDCCMYLLDKSKINPALCGNPTHVCRKLSAIVNSNDDGGVLTGNWSGNYSGGKSPLSWSGSAMILEQYYEQKYPVKFGQCWVFSGVLTTVLRALGIPARSVTNFESAHDTDSSVTIDKYYDFKGYPEEGLGDSIWNFHVWNEAWMARPDLPVGYGGWQAVDATPQEQSNGVMCCGPCPVQAIKEGEINLPFDAPFIFAEVNADKIYWRASEDGTYGQVGKIETNCVGKFISTMSVGGGREDVTNHYKHPEGSNEERTALMRAHKAGASSPKHDVYKTGPEDVKFELDFDAENTYVGSDFVVKVRCSNTGKEQRHVDGVLYASTMYYTGIVAENVGKASLKVSLHPGETKQVDINVDPKVYIDKLKDGCMLGVSSMVRVSETNQVFTQKDSMRLRKPHLVIKALNESKVGEELELHVSFTNPMPTTLTDCVLGVEATGIMRGEQFPQWDVRPNGTFTTTFKVKPRKQGKRQIVFIFSSTQLGDVNGTHDVIIRPSY
ncbi:protein-glutamine gamma-glutamyltransferase K-like [Littorina saxatilis]|uniref:Transglutaminase-like domain-containing protein n=1 Tax=Littorina saxatilis TaxID=31220 RepID=A0AAN9GQP0_9CAEN